MKHLIFALALVSGLASAKVYNIDTSHSAIGFKIRHLFSKTAGRFNDWKGTVDFDAKKKSLKFDVTIQSKSIDTSHKKRDAHLRNADFFNVTKYPTITFKSSSAKSMGKNRYRVTGKLNMHGKTQPVTLNMQFLGQGPDGRGNTKVGFTGSGKLSRKAFGLTYNSAMEGGGLVLGDEVEFTVDVEAQTKGAAKG